MAGKAADLPTRIASKIRVNPDTGCWEWTACVSHHGYARIRWGDSTTAVHRLTYELLVGPIPEGMQTDHLCRVRRCVNPAHLEAVTGRENLLRSPLTFNSVNAAKTHCHRGHPLSGPNVKEYRGRRICRECVRLNQVARYWRNRADPNWKRKRYEKRRET